MVKPKVYRGTLVSKLGFMPKVYRGTLVSKLGFMKQHGEIGDGRVEGCQ